MIVKGKDVIGLNVVTIDTGSVIETVDDIAYDPTNHRIVALLVDSGGLFSSAKAILMDDVRNIGEDAVIVHDATVIQSTKELGDSVRSISDSNKHLVKTNVLTVDGKELGNVTDIYFDSENGTVDSMEVSQGGLKTMTEGKKSIKPADIVTIGADATIVSTYTELKLESQGEEGGLKGAFNDAKEKASDFADDAKEAIGNAVETSKEKAAELSDKARVKASEVREDISDRVDDARDFIDEKSAEARVKAVELRDTVREKADDLAIEADRRAEDLKQRSRELTRDAKQKAAELSDAVEDNAHEAQRSARKQTAEAKEKALELVNKAQERTQDGAKKLKTAARDAAHSIDRTDSATVEETRHHYEGEDKIVDTKKTIVRK